MTLWVLKQRTWVQTRVHASSFTKFNKIKPEIAFEIDHELYGEGDIERKPAKPAKQFDRACEVPNSY